MFTSNQTKAQLGRQQVGNNNSERKPKLDERDYLVLGVILGILGTATYDMVRGFVAQLLPSISTYYDTAIGAYVVVGVLWYGNRRRKRRRKRELKDAGT